MKREIIDRYIQSFDELNVLVTGSKPEEAKDITETLLLTAYKRAKEDTEDMLDYLLDTESITDVQKIVYQKTDGMTFADRIDEVIKSETDIETSLKRIAETEFHRVYNETSLATAKRIEKATGRSISKTWVTVKDNRVRATHEPLEGVTKPLDEKFYTIDGDESYCPGKFENVANNVNCRCVLEYK